MRVLDTEKIMYKKKKKYVILLGIVSLILIVFIGLYFVSYSSYNLTYDNTSLFEIELSYVNVFENERGCSVELFTNEYDTCFYFSGISDRPDRLKEINNLKSGDTVRFRVSNRDLYQISNEQIVMIYSLETDNKEIVSFDEYRKGVQEASKPTTIAIFVVIIISLLIDVFCIIKLYRLKKIN